MIDEREAIQFDLENISYLKNDKVSRYPYRTEIMEEEEEEELKLKNDSIYLGSNVGYLYILV